MKRSLARTMAVLTAFAALSMLSPPAIALDPVEDAANVLLPSDCSITAANPSLLAGTVRSSGTLQCSTQRDALVIQVCLQYRQAVASENVTWQELACGTPQTRQNATSVSGSVSARCLPGEWAYRAVATGQVHRNGHVTQNGAGLKVSGVSIISCPLT